MKTFKIKQLNAISVCLLMMNFICYNTSFSQDATQLNIGDNAPSFVLSTSDNSIQSFTFPYQNKVVLLYFWSSSVSKSKENIYKYKRLYSKYSDIAYKSFDGFDVISVALQSDRNVWVDDLKKYKIQDMNNCISLKGYNDFYIKAYKIKITPSSFLIDENGKIIAVNPSLKTIIGYLDEKRNVELNSDVQTQISGKILYGESGLNPLVNEKVWVISGKNDTIKSVVLDEKGRFSLDNINTLVDLQLFFKSNSTITDEQTVFLASDNGEIVSAFSKNELGYDYTIMDFEMPYLKPLSFNNKGGTTNSSSSDKNTKELNVTEQLFKTKDAVLTKEAIAKLNSIVAKLKSHPKTRVEIISHTDSKSEAKLNTVVSQKQSNSILNFLISKGIAKSRLKSIGKGEDEIINKCKDGISCSDEEHNINNRTEFKFYPLP